MCSAASVLGRREAVCGAPGRALVPTNRSLVHNSVNMKVNLSRYPIAVNGYGLSWPTGGAGHAEMGAVFGI